MSKMNRKPLSLRVTFGPLRYLFLAHDDWGEKALSRIAENLDFRVFPGPPSRVIHLLEIRLTRRENKEINLNCLPDRLARLIPEVAPGQGWKMIGDESGCLSWKNQRTRDSFLAYNAVFPGPKVSFYLPWYALFSDLVEIGGGLLHGGLASRGDRGYIFTAPPGGGKTTTLSRIPAPWKVLSDDALLVWPVGQKIFRASPLPTWGNILGNSKTFVGDRLKKVSTSTRVAGALFLKKSAREELTPLHPLETARHLYRALSEHPAVVSARPPFRVNLFQTACNLAKSLPAWEIALTRNGNFWKLLIGLGTPAHSYPLPKGCKSASGGERIKVRGIKKKIPMQIISLPRLYAIPIQSGAGGPEAENTWFSGFYPGKKPFLKIRPGQA